MKTKKRKSVLAALLVIPLIAAMVIMSVLPSVEASETSKVADPSTLTDWTNTYDSTGDKLPDNNENLGRIWTDKTVSTEPVNLSPSGITVDMSDDADFLVALSAISSASSESTMSHTPLDIVLVLDVSGSMDDDLESYTEVYAQDLDTDEDYYISVNGRWREISYSNKRGAWRYDGRNYVPKTSAEDTDSGHTQFYVRDKQSKLSALQSSVNNFIDATAQQNDAITDVSKQHQIALVKFAGTKRDAIGNETYNSGGYTYNYTQIVSGLTPYTSQNSSGIKTTVNSFTAAGATSADYAMEHAATVLKNARTDAKKIVIFFTDGEPNHGSGFNGTVANDAIKKAKALKDGGATIYTIGVFKDADPTDTTKSNFNRYMHGMSSNYPNATSYDSLGTRAEDSNYYKAASSSTELNSIFAEISQDLAEPNYPTQTESGNPAHSGYITFTDTLGDYMEVKDLNSIVFANKNFTKKTTKTEGNTVTYTFEGEAGNVIYPEGNLNTIEISVTKGTSEQMGDTVAVKIPASLIPLRYYNIENDETSEDGIQMDITETYPIRVFYSVGMKDSVKTKIQSGNIVDEALKTYIAGHTSDGLTHFYSNAFDSNDSSKGKTTAEFAPATTNPFYYYTEDTPLYTDEACTERVTGINRFDPKTIYYYQNFYYGNENGKTTKKYSAIAVSGADLNNVAADHYGVDENGSVYMKAGSVKVSRMRAFAADKTENPTKTAATVINPDWDAGSSLATIYLGNNGRLSMNVPGNLAISKSVTADEGLTAPDREFTFTVHLTTTDKNSSGDITDVPLEDEYNYVLTDKDGNPILDDNNEQVKGTIKDGGTIILKDGQTATITDLPGGTKYTVTESEVDGFTNTSKSGDAGTISSGVIAEASFTNNYSVTPVTLDDSTVTLFNAQKVYNAWNTVPSTFTFVLTGNDGTPMPENIDGNTILTDSYGVSREVTDGNVFNFGEITYTRPGTYEYSIYEITPNDQIPGVDYSNAVYTVTVVVVDNGDGTLSIDESRSGMIKTHDDDGTDLDDPAEATCAVIENVFEATSARGDALARKNYTDNSGNNPLTSGKFNFRIEPVTSGAPSPSGYSSEAGYAQVGNSDTTIAFSVPDFTVDHLGQSYVYKIYEVIPAEATADNNYTVNGMTYDPTVYYAKMTVSETEDQNNPGTAIIVVTTTYYTDEALTNEAESVTFNNIYTPASVTLTEDAGTSLHGTKTMTGRDMLDGEAFGFRLAAANDSTSKAVNDGIVEFAQDGSIASVSGGNENEAVAFSFGDMTFKKPGTYTFAITEDVPDVNPGNGVTYDTHTCTVTVTVTDNNGALEADVRYSDGTQAEFTNRYTASSVTLDPDHYINVQKIFDGREWTANDRFYFQLTALNGAPMPADNRINISSSENGTDHFDNITYDSAGVYEYEIREDSNTGTIGGVTYDNHVWKVTITVQDDKQGSLYIDSVVYNNNDADAPDTNNTAAVFTNTYSSSGSLDGAAALKVTKNFNGRANNEWLDTDAFTFVLAADTTDAATVEAVNDGNIVLPDTTLTVTKANRVNATFGNIVFSKTGTYKFTVTEQEGTIPGVTYDTTPRTITVNVTDNNDGTMTAVVDATQSDALTFNNTYGTSDLTLSGDTYLKVEKALTGRGWFETDAFTFTLAAGDDDTQEAITDGVVVLPDNADGITIGGTDAVKEKAFGDIIFKETGNYRFVITETKGTIDGIGYDEHSAVIDVTVTDNNAGQLVTAAPTITGSMTFTNIYTPTPVTAAFTGMKTMSGRELLSTDKFSFTVEKAADSPEGTPMPAETTVENGADGSIQFAPITYTEAGTYKYIIRETGGSAAGVTNDSGSVEVTVEVTYDAATGVLTPKVSYVKTGGNGGEGFTFTNTYGADSTDSVAVFSAKKAVTPSDGNSYEIKGGEFEFKITPGADNPTSDPITEMTARNDADGNVVFTSGVQYTEPGVYTYNVREVNNALPGMSYDASEYVITVTVTDNQTTAKLEAAASITKNGTAVDAIRFDNSYDPAETSANFSGKKELTGKTLEADMFSFVLAPVDGAPMPDTDTVKNTAAGTFQFGNITYTVPGTYQYKISEADGQAVGYTYDKSVYTVTVEVTDENGELKAVVSGADNIVFKNDYTPIPVTLSGDTALTGTKTLTGRKMNEGEFTFQLMDAGGNVVAEAVNRAEGSFVLEPLTFSEVGTYYYTILEKNTGLGGVTYDTDSYTVKVDVTDVNGYLNAKVTYLDAQGKEAKAAFENVYKAQPTSVQIGAVKKLQGRDLKDGEFTFLLKDESGKVVAKAANDAQGVILFEEMTFEKAGTYRYTVSEEKGKDENVTYDETVYPVTVTVEDGLKGALSAKVEYEGEALVFNNTYKEPVKPTAQEKPKTGDQTRITLYGLVMLLAVLVAAEVVLIRRRRNNYYR